MSIPLRAAHRLAALVVALALLPGCSLRPAETAGPAAVQAPSTPAAAVVPLPDRVNSVKFAVLGDFGTGSPAEYQLASQMVKTHATFPFNFVLTVGDNIYGSQRPQDFANKFELPYKPLLDAGVKFYASLGNHDSREQRQLQAVQHGRQALLLHSSLPTRPCASLIRKPTRRPSKSTGWKRS